MQLFGSIKNIHKIIQKNCCILSKIEENGKTFALMPPRPGLGMAFDDDDDSKHY